MIKEFYRDKVFVKLEIKIEFYNKEFCNISKMYKVMTFPGSPIYI